MFGTFKETNLKTTMKRTQLTEEEAEKRVVSQFPSIEALLECEDFSKVNKNFAEVHEALEKINRSRGGLGKSTDVRKALKAIERVMDLLRELLKIKYQMNSSPGDSHPQKKI